jgi:hypothetical protein
MLRILTHVVFDLFPFDPDIFETNKQITLAHKAIVIIKLTFLIFLTRIQETNKQLIK